MKDKAEEYLKKRGLNYKSFRISGTGNEAITIPQIMEAYHNSEMERIMPSDGEIISAGEKHGKDFKEGYRPKESYKKGQRDLKQQLLKTIEK